MDRILSNVQLVTSLPKNIGFPDHNETKVFLKLQASFCKDKAPKVLFHEITLQFRKALRKLDHVLL